jgi:F420-non-reducing hydrogenase small subunit
VSEKPKIALYWCSSCGGCEESVVDLAEDLLDIAAKVDIVFWPVAIDMKHSDVEALADGEIAATLINGAVRMDEQAAMATLLREKSQLVIAHGACAHLGGVVGLANFFSKEAILNRAYREVPSLVNPEGVMPETTEVEGTEAVPLSALHDWVKPLNQVIDVDYYLPGCPPTPALVKNALMAVLEDRLPPRGSVLAEKKALCHTCPRRESRPIEVHVTRFKRVYEVEWDPATCFLAQDLLCLGPATRGGCAARCIGGNMPCRGCFGPTDHVADQGAKSISLIASLLGQMDEEELKNAVSSVPDLSGLVYRFSLASSLLKRRLS